jgi:hypothetical protein
VPGLFGFFLHDPRDPAWAARQFARMRGSMRDAATARQVETHAARAWVGQTGPDILPGNLVRYGDPPAPTLLAEGECYHHDHHCQDDEKPGGPWRWLRDRWLAAGAEGVSAVDGLYTLALLETEVPRLRLINDRYGSRRLYLLPTARAFVFATELAPLLTWPEARTLDDDFVRQSVCLGSALDGRTWLRGVTLMPPATEVVVTPGQVTMRRHWSWDSLGRADATGDGDDRRTRAETLRHTWRRAVDARLGGDRVGQLLSGGLDSRIILGDGARRHQGDWLAITYGEPGSDEVRFAARAAAVAGVSWQHWPLPEPDWLETRTRFCLTHDGVIDIVNAFHAAFLGSTGSRLRWDLGGYLGDLILGATYEARTVEEAMGYLPYWHSPIAMPEGEVRQLMAASAGTGDLRGWLVETKCRRAINAWPHTAVDVLEVRKPFMDYALVELMSRWPLASRAAHEPHRVLLAEHPALAAVPWQKTGVPLDASSARWWGLRARRVAYRQARMVLGHVGVHLAPWIRGAVDLGRWLDAPAVRQRLHDELTSPHARVRGLFGAEAIAQTLDATLDARTVAHEPLLHLYRAERMLAHLAARVAAVND